MISVQVDPTRAFLKVARIDNLSRMALRGVIVELTKSLGERVRQKLSGEVLNRRSGALYDSIQSEMIENQTTVYGRVYVNLSSPAMKYAGIHEFGGVIQHPGSDKFQAWMGPNGMVYTHKTRPHAIPMPQRSYLKSSLADMQGEIIARMTSAVKSAARAA